MTEWMKRRQGGPENNRALSQAEWAEVCTGRLRESAAPRWSRLRDRLRSAGIPLEEAAVTDLHPEDSRMEYALIVSREGRVFGFYFDYGRDPEGNPIHNYDDAWVSNWRELDQSQRKLYSAAIEVGVALLS